MPGLKEMQGNSASASEKCVLIETTATDKQEVETKGEQSRHNVKLGNSLLVSVRNVKGGNSGCTVGVSGALRQA